jgi:putative oxidoreductase
VNAHLGPASLLALLAQRLWIGLNLARRHGLEKARDPELFIESIEMRRFPWHETLGWCAIAAQLGGGVLLAVGFKTRVAAFALSATMVGAAYVALDKATWDQRELPLTYAIALAFFAIHGAGPFSVDSRLERMRRKQNPW